MAELTTAEQAAYRASFKKAKKQQARDKGAADAGGDPIIEAARQRALQGSQPTAPARTQAAAATAAPKPSGEFIQRPDGSRVPIEYFDLPAESKARFDSLLKGEEASAESESLALQYSKTIGDQQVRDAKRISALESQLVAALSAMEAMQRRMSNIDTSVEAGKSDALIEAESQLAQTIVNAGAVKAQLDSSTASSAREMEIQRLDHDARMTSLEAPVAELEGRVKSSAVLMGERSNAVVDQLAAMEGQHSRLGVQLTELEGRTDAIGNPITRAEVKDMVTSTVASEFPAQLPAMVSKELAVQKATGELGEGIEIDRGYLAQSLENSDERSKRFEISEQQIEESKFTNPTERAINCALKKARRD